MNYKNLSTINTLNSIIASPEPYITICMVNYRRYDILLNTLRRYKSFNLKINLLLWINDSSFMPKHILDEVQSICKETFVKHCIFKCQQNVGTSISRNHLLKYAYEEYQTPYVMTTDDDISFSSKEALVISAAVLEQKEFQEFGAIGINCVTTNHIIKIKDMSMVAETPKIGLQEVDVLGAASMMIRRDVLKECNVDPLYKRIGLIDWDFSMTIKAKGWKLGFIYDKDYQVINNANTNDIEYNRNRYHKESIKAAYYRFKGKWGVEPIIGKHWIT